MMRTTLTLSDDVYEAARALAHQQRISLGDAVSQLARKGLRPAPVIDKTGGVPVIRVAPSAKPITLEHTLALEDEL